MADKLKWKKDGMFTVSDDAENLWVWEIFHKSKNKFQLFRNCDDLIGTFRTLKAAKAVAQAIEEG